jgi:hypothetical protein
MKAKYSFLLVPAFAAIIQFSPVAFAQSPDKPGRQFWQERRARWAGLNDEERARLRAAHHKALEDPAVQAAQVRMKQARREFREIMRPAMLKADPSIQPILDKMRAARPGRD